MAKTAGYMRGYRQQRRANRGRPLGRALSGSERDEVASLMANYGYTRARAIAEVRGTNELLKVQMAAMGGNLSLIKPRTKPPRGFAAEWRARETIHKTIAKSEQRSSSMGFKRSQYRGQSTRRWEDTRRSAVQEAMHIFRQEARQIVAGPGTWQQKAKEIQLAYKYSGYWVN